jgi:hypothetical protein
MFARAPWTAVAVFACVLAFSANAWAGPYVWDQDEDGLDDRMETVQLLGYRFSFENADTLLRQRFDVVPQSGGLAYGMYVVYDHAPTDSDALSLTLTGLPVLQRLVAVPAIHTFGSFAQAQLARNLAGVERIEIVPILYPVLVDGAAAIGVRDASERVFPTLATTPGAPDGHGVVVAIVDTGVNDEADGGYPGHESVLGRCLGGASVLHGNSASDTPHGSSVNPKDHGGLATRAHATHVAGIVLGSGGATGAVKGVAPGARYVDVKALDDTGNGQAVAEAIDWCIANRNRDWGDPDPSFTGIDVINLSLSSLDPSDGNDVASRAAARAVELGIVVVASMGNEGGSGVPSPAAGDGVIAVGAWDVQRSGLPADDQFPSFDPTGPRASDGDADATDELKPTLLAPGVFVLSADGDPSSDGAQYRRASGTSAAAAFVSGAAAVLKSADPALTPSQIARRLTETARRAGTGWQADAPSIDPRWSASRGFGVLDLHAARLEQTQPARTQIRRLGLAPGANSEEIVATLETMRERGTSWLAFERAPDVAGVPGTFAVVDSVAPAGDSSLADAANLASYARTWPVPPAERGVRFWYRAAYTEGGTRFVTPARAYASPSGPAVATVEVVIVHNAYDNDVDAVVEAAGAVGGPVVVRAFPLPGSTAAASFDWVTGVSATGNIALTFELSISAEQADGMLPPSPSTPWTLRVDEGGFLNRSGRVASFRVIHHTQSGDVTYEGAPAPASTFEGQETVVRIPAATVAVEPGPGARAALWPNPVSAGETVTFASDRAAPEGVEIFDLSGRRIGRASLHAAGESRSYARWTARDASGRALAAGVYFARIGRSPHAARLVILP